MKGRKGQSEIVGFVLIVVIVSIALLVLLSIGLRDTGDTFERESREIHQFLESMMEYSSECVLGTSHLSVGELIRECNKNSGSLCSSGDRICDVLDSTSGEIIDASWQIGPDRPIKGYIFNSTFEGGEILSFSEGSCEGGFEASELLAPQLSGTIVSSLKLCF